MQRYLLAPVLIIILAVIILPPKIYSQDTTNYVDANRILMYAGNDGILANDFFRETSSGFGGFFYNGDTSSHVIWASGLWVVGKVGGNFGTAMAYYSAGRTYTEFAPGPYQSTITDHKKLRVYKISSGDLVMPGDDWNSWPADLGAPLDSLGRPLLSGNQTLFSVYNDADTSRRDYSTSSPEPLGAEVRQLVYAYDKERYLGNVVFVQLEIINKSSRLWDSLYLGLYADPDLGRPDNDLVGSYGKASLVFGYSDKFDEEMTTNGYSVAGIAFLGGRCSGQNRYTQYIATHTNPTPFFPATSQAAFDMLKGLDSLGNPYLDPTTLQTTPLIYNGDPRYEVGWLDNTPGDKSFLISHGPYRLGAGERLVLDFAFVAAAADNKAEALTELFVLSEKALDWHKYGPDGIRLARHSGRGQISEVSFSPDYQNWLEGVAFQGDFNSSGIGKASALLGSALSDTALQSVDLLFSHDSTQQVYYYYLEDNHWNYAGFRPVPVRAFDTLGRQLDMLLLSENGRDCGYCLVDPREREDQLTRLLITASRYSGTARAKYENLELLTDFDKLDLQYLFQFRPRLSNRLNNLIEGQRLSIHYSYGRDYSGAESYLFDSTPVSLSKSAAIFIASAYLTPMNVRTEVSNPRDFSLNNIISTIPEAAEAHLYINFHPGIKQAAEAVIKFYNLDFEEYFEEIKAFGYGTAWPLAGDFNLNGWLDPADIALYIAHLYGGRQIPAVPIMLDLNASGKIDLADIVVLINILFRSPAF